MNRISKLGFGKALAILLAAALLVWLLFFAGGSKNFTMTVQATVLEPTDETYYVQEYGGYIRHPVRPKAAAQISSGTHDAPWRQAAFKNGVLTAGFGYGPFAVQGAFDPAALKAADPSLTLDRDWEFGFGSFNTHGLTDDDDVAVRLYLEVRFETGSDRAEAVLYLFYEGSASPRILNWQGKIGERIRFAGDI